MVDIALPIPIVAAGGLLSPSAQVLLYTVIVFLLLLAILWKFAWGPLLKALQEREDKIAKRISDAEERFKQSEERAAEYQRKIEAAKNEAAEIIAEGKRDAEKVREETIAAGNEEATRIIERAKREIGLAKDQAVQELRDQMVAVTANLATRVIEREVKGEDHARFIETVLTQVESSPR